MSPHSNPLHRHVRPLATGILAAAVACGLTLAGIMTPANAQDAATTTGGAAASAAGQQVPATAELDEVGSGTEADTNMNASAYGDATSGATIEGDITAAAAAEVDDSSDHNAAAASDGDTSADPAASRSAAIADASTDASASWASDNTDAAVASTATAEATATSFAAAMADATATSHAAAMADAAAAAEGTTVGQPGCAAPTNLATSTTPASITANWTYPTSETTFSYRLTASSGAEIESGVVPGGTDARQITVHGLQWSAWYQVVITANCADGTSAPATTSTWTAHATCTGVSNLRVRELTSTTAELLWDYTGTDTNPTVQISYYNYPNGWQHSPSMAAGVGTATLTGLLPGEYHRVSVRTGCDNGGNTYQHLNVTTPVTENDCRIRYPASTLNDDRTAATITWTIDGGTPERITYIVNDHAGTQVTAGTLPGETTTLPLTGLTPDTYYFLTLTPTGCPGYAPTRTATIWTYPDDWGAAYTDATAAASAAASAAADAAGAAMAAANSNTSADTNTSGDVDIDAGATMDTDANPSGDVDTDSAGITAAMTDANTEGATATADATTASDAGTGNTSAEDDADGVTPTDPASDSGPPTGNPSPGSSNTPPSNTPTGTTNPDDAGTTHTEATLAHTGTNTPGPLITAITLLTVAAITIHTARRKRPTT